MASEPELRAGSGGEWVLYLQQSLNHHYQQQVIAESGEFDDALAGVVRHFQRQWGMEPTGVVDAATWRALTGGGVIATRYRWPDEPVATAVVPVDGAVVELSLTLAGELTEPVAPQDLVADLTADPPAVAGAGAAFLTGTPTLLDASRLAVEGGCELTGATDLSGYQLLIAVLADGAPDWAGGTEPDSPEAWLAHHTGSLAAAGVVPLVAVAGPVEVGG
jgi:peptidoglycan hydrolase-like protein with peptidoglycan-binding domain